MPRHYGAEAVLTSGQAGARHLAPYRCVLRIAALRAESYYRDNARGPILPGSWKDGVPDCGLAVTLDVERHDFVIGGLADAAGG